MTTQNTFPKKYVFLSSLIPSKEIIYRYDVCGHVWLGQTALLGSEKKPSPAAQL